MFDYDPQKPLDLQEHHRWNGEGVEVRDISYASPLGGRVPALLILPQGQGPFAGLLYLHPGGNGLGRHSFLQEASLVAQAGTAALLVAAPYARAEERPVFQFNQQDRSDFIQAVVDLRRGVDLLAARTDIDPDRIGCVGFSYGAVLAALLAGVEERLRAYLIWAGGAYLAPMLRSLAKTLSPVELENYLEQMAVFDPVDHIGRAAPAALLFQNGRQDQGLPQTEVEALYQAASQPKQIAWYAAGHALNGRACQDRFAWLQEQLGLNPLPADLLRALGKFKLKQMVRR
ncbi:MAG: dienelactone hydrolase family protein [Anaerolineales bacterium]|nr:dienelactone hydrolase family protein [Anaerolineales bacterium]